MPAVSNIHRSSLRSETSVTAAGLGVTTPRPIPSDQAPETYLTRRQATDFINSVLGRPLSFSTATRLASLGEFAQPAVWWGLSMGPKWRGPTGTVIGTTVSDGLAATVPPPAAGLIEPGVEALIISTGIDFRVGGHRAFG